MKPIKTFYHNNKEIRIYEWTKRLGDFPIPKGFDWCKYFDFVDVINKDKVELERFPVEYFVKNQFKENIKKWWNLSRVCLTRSGFPNSYGDDFEFSCGNGRVVVSKELSKEFKK